MRSTDDTKTMIRLIIIGGLAWASLSLAETTAPLKVKTPQLRWSTSTAVEFSSGDYQEDEATEILFAAQSLRFERGNTALRVTVPWLRIDGPADIIGGGDPNAEPGDRRSIEGLGDVQLGLSHRLKLHDRPVWITPSIHAKVPTADEEERLGSGEWDYWARVLAMCRLRPTTTAYASGGFRWMGSNQDFPLEDRALAGAGLYQALGKLGVGLTYDFQQSSVESFEDQHEVGGYLTTRLGPFQPSLYGRTGFTNASPDWSVGLNVGLQLPAP